MTTPPAPIAEPTALHDVVARRLAGGELGGRLDHVGHGRSTSPMRPDVPPRPRRLQPHASRRSGVDRGELLGALGLERRAGGVDLLLGLGAHRGEARLVLGDVGAGGGGERLGALLVAWIWS